jgi:hypothetical protein
MRKRTPWDLPGVGARRSTRLRWFLLDLRERAVEPVLLLRWWLEDFFAAKRARLLGAVLVLAALILGGFAAAFTIARTTPSASGRTVRIVTLRQRVQTRTNGRIVTHWRLRKVYAQPQNVLETRTIRTPNGMRLVTHPVTRYRVAYRKEVVTAHGQTQTVVRPVTNAETLTRTVTSQVANTQLVTQVVTVTHPVTVGVTTTVVSTKTVPLPITVTITIP